MLRNTFKVIYLLYSVPRWRSSLWKLLWRELLVYTLLYVGISLLYRLGLQQESKAVMRKLIRWCRAQLAGIYIQRWGTEGRVEEIIDRVS